MGRMLEKSQLSENRNFTKEELQSNREGVFTCFQVQGVVFLVKGRGRWW